MGLAEKSKKFLDYLEEWVGNLPTLAIDEVITHPEKTAIISVDVINGFLYEGPLSSPRVAKIGEPISELMSSAWDQGVRDILLVQEGHQPGSLEFEAFGEHAVKGSHEAETIDLIKALPFYDQLTTLYKESIHPAINNDFEPWVDERSELDTFISVGDVTDLCLYQLATYLRFTANAHHKQRRVIVPENCTQTWHLSVKDAKNGPAMPHHGDLLHATFLYHLALNGVEVVKQIIHS
jgi:nicotinamidase-related amidase